MDRPRLAELGLPVIRSRIASEHHHDPLALARALLRIAQRGVPRDRAVR
jgi:hypothetical protein